MPELTQSSPIPRNSWFHHDLVLACAALSPSLRTILAFDVDRGQLEELARRLTSMLITVGEHPVHRTTLGSAETEDSLWVRLEVHTEAGGLLVYRRPGRLAAQDSGVMIVVVPDLALLDVSAVRAVVTLAGADVVHLERHGLSRVWTPRLIWLAGCSTAAVGRVSLHVLDRFALRLHSAVPTPDEATELLAELREDKRRRQRGSAIPADLLDALMAAAGRRSEVGWAALDAVVRYFPLPTTHTARREVALTRAAAAIARLDGDSEVGESHVDAAAEMLELGLGSSTDTVTPSLGEQEVGRPSADDGDRFDSSGGAGALGIMEGPRATSVEGGETLIDASPPATLDQVAISGAEGLYPEDWAEPQREATPLRFPRSKRSQVTASRGPVAGVEPATELRDLAVVATLLEAAKYQRLRLPHVHGRPRLPVLPRDLRRYRRLPVPEQMLTLVLDHTSARQWNWTNDLLPYLRWAYAERASIALIEVGAKGGEALRATKVEARSLLDERVALGLQASPGSATPLAHGLELALETIRHAVQHGAGLVQHVWLVVATDGRGNVPLRASHVGAVVGAVHREGVDDALAVASQLGALDGVRSVVITPNPRLYAYLPFELADALGGTAVTVSSGE